MSRNPNATSCARVASGRRAGGARPRSRRRHGGARACPRPLRAPAPRDHRKRGGHRLPKGWPLRRLRHGVPGVRPMRRGSGEEEVHVSCGARVQRGGRGVRPAAPADVHEARVRGRGLARVRHSRNCVPTVLPLRQRDRRRPRLPAGPVVRPRAAGLHPRSGDLLRARLHRPARRGVPGLVARVPTSAALPRRRHRSRGDLRRGVLDRLPPAPRHRRCAACRRRRLLLGRGVLLAVPAKAGRGLRGSPDGVPGVLRVRGGAGGQARRMRVRAAVRRRRLRARGPRLVPASGAEPVLQQAGRPPPGLAGLLLLDGVPPGAGRLAGLVRPGPGLRRGAVRAPRRVLLPGARVRGVVCGDADGPVPGPGVELHAVLPLRRRAADVAGVPAGRGVRRRAVRAGAPVPVSEPGEGLVLPAGGRALPHVGRGLPRLLRVRGRHARGVRVPGRQRVRRRPLRARAPGRLPAGGLLLFRPPQRLPRRVGVQLSQVLLLLRRGPAGDAVVPRGQDIRRARVRGADGARVRRAAAGRGGRGVLRAGRVLRAARHRLPELLLLRERVADGADVPGRAAVQRRDLRAGRPVLVPGLSAPPPPAGRPLTCPLPRDTAEPREIHGVPEYAKAERFRADVARPVNMLPLIYCLGFPRRLTY